jgi:hypothetical protein
MDSTAADTASKEVTLTWYALPVPENLCQQTIILFTLLGVGGGSTLDAILLLDVLRCGNGFLVAVVPDCDVGACFCQGVSNCKADACTCAGHDGGAPFEGEEWKDAV